jgi:hypothetical protein
MSDSTVKTYTCRLKIGVIQSIKQFAVQNNVSQSVVLEKAINCITDGTTDDIQNVRQIMVEELRQKNQQIEGLQNTINQQNHLLLFNFKESGLLIEGKVDTEPTKKKKSKKKSKPKKGKKKKKK